jgi:hypothetical protein
MESKSFLIVELGFLNCDAILKVTIGNRVEIINDLEIEVIMDLTLYCF